MDFLRLDRASAGRIRADQAKGRHSADRQPFWTVAGGTSVVSSGVGVGASVSSKGSVVASVTGSVVVVTVVRAGKSRFLGDSSTLWQADKEKAI